MIDSRSKIGGIKPSFLMKRLLLLPLLLGFTRAVNAEPYYLYWSTFDGSANGLVVQEDPSLHSNLFSSLSKCKAAGEKIANEIYKPIKFFDGRWTCVEK